MKLAFFKKILKKLMLSVEKKIFKVLTNHKFSIKGQGNLSKYITDSYNFINFANYF